jgi:hypothetical protein
MSEFRTCLLWIDIMEKLDDFNSKTSNVPGMRRITQDRMNKTNVTGVSDRPLNMIHI